MRRMIVGVCHRLYLHNLRKASREFLTSNFKKFNINEWLSLFTKDLNIYLQKKLQNFAHKFEHYKGYLVRALMVKRGRYKGRFLNLSFFVLTTAGILAAPYLSDYYPTVNKDNILLDTTFRYSTVSAINVEDVSMITKISEKPRDQIIDYKVQKGDTLSLIAKKFDVSKDTIRWANKLKGKNPVLKPSQILKIPPVTGIVHRVKRGETVYSIAEKYKTEAQKIVNFPFNDFVDLDNFTLSVGQSLIVPDGVMPKAKPLIRPMAPKYLAGSKNGKFLFPTTGNISQNPVWYHMAIDIANKSAPDIFAAEAGRVTTAKCNRWGYGCHIIVDHGKGVQTLYAHMSKFYVSVGEKIGRGEALGKMGSTGRSTGTHLHFEVRINGRLMNPWNYLR